MAHHVFGRLAKMHFEGCGRGDFNRVVNHTINGSIDMADLDSLQKNVLTLLRDPGQWAKFSASTQAAMEVAKTWRVAVTEQQAEILTAVLGRLRSEVDDALTDCLNQASSEKVTHVVLLNGIPQDSNMLKANGVKGGGGGPKHWRYELRLSMGVMAALGVTLEDIAR